MKKNSTFKRFLAFLLCAAMMVTYMPSSVYTLADANVDGPQAISQEAPKTEESAPAETVEKTEEPSKDAETPKEETKEEAAPEKEEPVQTEPAKDTSTEEPAKADEPSEEAGAADEQAAEPEQDAEEEATEPEQAKEEPEEDEAYPAQHFEESTFGLDRVKVFVDAPNGALPKGTTMKVKNVAESKVIDTVVNELGDKAKFVKAVDITFYDKDGNEIEPKEGSDPLSVSFKSSKLENLNEPAVVHIDNKKVETISDEDVKNKGDKVSFEADQFSIYVVVETGQDARALVKFMNGETEIDSMYVKSGDDMETVLYDPSGKLNLDEGVIFKGWTTNPDYSVADAANALDIGEVRTEVSGMLPPDSDGDEIIYYAMLYKKYTVTYLDTKEAAIHQDSILYRADATGNDLKQDYVVSWNYTPEDDTHDFEGWFVNEGGNNIEGFDASANEGKGTLYEYEQDITISGDVTFSVFAPEGHWLVFDENGKGATYNAPQFVKAGENTRAPSLDMVRNGYTFGGWYYFPNNDAPEPDATTKEVDLTNATLFSFGGTLSERTTIYAKWTPITDAAYTVIIWKQNLAGNGYDFVEAVPKNGRVGTTPNAVRNNGSVDGARYNGETGFSFNNTDQASKVIAPEGNTVVNVYYNRNSYTWTFQDYTYTQNTRGEYVYWPGGYYRTGTYNYTYYYYPEGYYSRDNYNGTDEDTYGVGPSPVYNVSNNATVTYYTKNTNGTYSSHTYTAHRYNRSSNRTTIKTITALYGQNISDQFPITGSNGITYDDGQRWTPVNTQIVTQTIVSQETMPAGNATFYMNAGTKRPLKTMNYYVEALPGDTNTVNYLGVDYVLYNTITARYNRVTETEDFFDIDGFRKVTSNPEFVNGVALNDSDSDGTINLYYSRKVYSLNFMDGSYFDGNGNRITTETSSGHIHDVGNIPYGSDLTSYNKNGADYYIPTAPEGYVFEGWYIDSACSAQSPFTFNTMPEGGITVYAKWRQIQYRVFLHPNAGTDQSLDWGSDSQEMNFRVSYGGKVSAPTGRRTGYNFIGWYLDKDCTKVFSDSLVLNDSSVTTPYDKENHFTEGMNKWGTGATSNGDLDRFWITKEFNLYGKWSKVLEGADGINVVYSLRDPDAGTGSGSAVDNNVYVDNSNATAAAAVNAPEGYRFAYWIVQDYENGAYVDTDTHVYAGGNFSVLEENAKKEGTGEYVKDKDDNYLDANGNITTDPSKYVEIHVYTVQLRAKYVRAEDAVPTHIYWYKNDGTAGPIHEDPAEDQTLEINEGVGIQAAPERDGYDFVGWAKVNEPSDPSTYAPEDVTGTMLLYYDEEHGYFRCSTRKCSFSGSGR